GRVRAGGAVGSLRPGCGRLGCVSAQILDGKAVAEEIKADLAERVTALSKRGITPGLGTLLVGDDPGSHIYVDGKHRDCARVGIESIRIDLPAHATQEQVVRAGDQSNADTAGTGYLVQLPLPKGLHENAVIAGIDPAKDGDGLHPTNLGWLVLGKQAPLPCTPNGILTLLRRHDIDINGAQVCV